MIRIIRTIAGILVGLLIISTLVEGLEFGLVTLIHGQTTTDPEIYYSIRNQSWFLGLKLIYNTLAAVIGGYFAALIAGYEQLKHGIALAIIQTLSFGFALSQPGMSQWTPIWMWIALAVLSFTGIIFGARILARRQTSGRGNQLKLA